SAPGDQYGARSDGCPAKSLLVGRDEPADDLRKPDRVAQPHPGRGLRGGNLEYDACADPAASGNGDARASERATAERVVVVEVIELAGASCHEAAAETGRIGNFRCGRRSSLARKEASSRSSH